MDSTLITVNGTSRFIPVGWSVAHLLADVGIQPERVAVEVNQEVLERRSYGRRLLQSGDTVEIITFVGGGSRHRDPAAGQPCTRPPLECDEPENEH